MLSIEEILKVTEEMGIEVKDSTEGKHYILDDSGKEIEFTTDMVTKMNNEIFSHSLDLQVAKPPTFYKFSGSYNLSSGKDPYSPGPINANELDIIVA